MKGNSDSNFSVDEILAQVRAERNKQNNPASASESHLRSMQEIDELLKPRKRIELSDILTDELFEAAGESPRARETYIPEVKRAEEEKKLPPADEKTRVVTPATPRQKNIISSVLEREDKDREYAIETDEIRRRFINRPVQKIEKTAEYEKVRAQKAPEPIERPGVVSRRSALGATADLAPLPTLVTPEDAAKEKKKSSFITKIREEAEKEREIEGQLRFDAFSSPEEEIEDIDEEIAEENLRKKRSEKIKSFRLFGEAFRNDDGEDAEITPDSEPEDVKSGREEAEIRKKEKRRAAKETEDPEDISSFEADIVSRKREYTISMAVSAVCAVGLILYAAIMGISGAGSFTVLKILNLAAVTVAAFAALPEIVKGFKSLFAGRPGADTALAAVFIAAELQAVSVMFAGDEKFPLYGGLAALYSAFTFAGKRMIEKRAFGNLKFMQSKGEKFSVSTIDDKDVAFEVGRGLLMGEPDVRCAVPLEFPGKFREYTYDGDPADKISKILVPVFTALSLISAAVYGIINKSFMGGVSAFAGCICVSLPACALIASNLPLGRACCALLRRGAMLAGHRAAEECGETDAVIFDSSDIFTEGGCTVYGIKPYNKMRIDEAVLAAAAVVIEAGGPCGEVFDRVILGKRELLPPVENLVYEDRLGLSAWIHGRRVLVGNRDLLINHNVEAPDKASEQKYRHDDRQVMYLAVAGKIAAMFVVGYRADKETGRALRALADKGISILIRTSDANITEELVSNFFGLHQNSVKIISAVAGEMYQKYRTSPKKSTSCAVLCTKPVSSMLDGLNSAVGLSQKLPLPLIVQIGICAVGFALTALLLFLSGFAHIGVASLALYQIAGAALCGICAAGRKV